MTGARVIPAGATEQCRQGLTQFHGVSADSVGATSLCAHLLEIPPGRLRQGPPALGPRDGHLRLAGRAVMWFGYGLTERLGAGPGDFVYIPSGVPHLPINLSQTEPVRALVARTGPNEQESVVLMPELDELAHITTHRP